MLLVSKIDAILNQKVRQGDVSAFGARSRASSLRSPYLLFFLDAEGDFFDAGEFDGVDHFCEFF